MTIHLCMVFMCLYVYKRENNVNNYLRPVYGTTNGNQFSVVFVMLYKKEVKFVIIGRMNKKKLNLKEKLFKKV